MAKSFSLLLAFVFMVLVSSAQIREVPAPVKDSFARRYPTAEQASYDDKLTSIHVSFTMGGTRMIAKFSNKGQWKETEQDWTFDKAPEDVRDGFWKSKYADWKVQSTALITLPEGERYRLKVENGELNRKYLFFNKNGRLVRDSRTL